MKKILILILTLTFFTIQTTEVKANTLPTNSTYTTLSILYKYIYKQENGITYRRLINEATGKPVTPWERI